MEDKRKKDCDNTKPKLQWKHWYHTLAAILRKSTCQKTSIYFNIPRNIRLLRAFQSLACTLFVMYALDFFRRELCFFSILFYFRCVFFYSFHPPLEVPHLAAFFLIYGVQGSILSAHRHKLVAHMNPFLYINIYIHMDEAQQWRCFSKAIRM